MVCQDCGKSLMDDMKYCPYCGCSLISGVMSEQDTRKEIIEAEYKEGKFVELMRRACNEDDVLAKYYCILYAEREGNQTFMFSFKDIFENSPIDVVNKSNKFYYTCWDVYHDHKEVNRESTVTNFCASAKVGEVAAMTFVAQWLMYGQRGLTKNPQMAYQYIKAASEKEYPPALYLRGIWHYQGGGDISKNEELGYRLIEKAAFYGHREAISLLSKNIKHWRTDELKHDAEEDTFEEIHSLLQTPKEKLLLPTGYDVDELLENPQMEEIYGDVESEEYKVEKERIWSRIYKCKTVEDYSDLYEEIRKEEYTQYDINPILNWLMAAIETITKEPFADRETREQRQKESEMYARNEERARDMIDSYTKLEQFTNMREEFSQNNIVLKKGDEKKIYSYAMDKILKNHEEDIKAFRIYLSSRDEIKPFGGKIVIGIVLSILAIFLSPILAVIVAVVFAVIVGRQVILNMQAERRMKETFQVYNEVDTIRKKYDIQL